MQGSSLSYYSSRAIALAWKLISLPYEISTRRYPPQQFSPVLPTVFASTYNISLPEQQPLTQPDYYLGYRFASGKEFIGQKDFVSIETLLDIAISSGRRIILNIGDSSTSGWDSHVVTRNRSLLLTGEKRLELPLFKYKTYPDFLADQIQREDLHFITINAGIPGYTSLQGTRYLTELLTIFQSFNVSVAAVTIYFGNNDCTWNSNFEDLSILPSGNSTLPNECALAVFDSNQAGRTWITKRLMGKRSTETDIVRTRVGLDGYLRNISDMCTLARAYGALPIAIVPPVPINWYPGQRVEGESLEQPWMLKQPGGELVLRNLDLAKNLWTQAQNLSDKFRETTLIEACENDFILPRIKHLYSSSLRNLCAERTIPLINLGIDRSRPEADLFLDYCHPIGDLNREIAAQIVKHVKDADPATSTKDKPVLNSELTALNSAIVRKAMAKVDTYHKRRARQGAQHSTIYPLY